MQLPPALLVSIWRFEEGTWQSCVQAACTSMQTPARSHCLSSNTETLLVLAALLLLPLRSLCVCAAHKARQRGPQEDHQVTSLFTKH
jgi:hypothetical protein